MSFTTPSASISEATGIADPDTLPTSNQDPAAVAAAIADPSNTLTQPPAPVPPTVPVTVSNRTVTAPNTTLAIWASAILTFLITVGSAAVVLPEHHTQLDLLQFAVFAVPAFGALFARVITTGPWPGVVKTGINIVGAILALAVPLVQASGRIEDVSATQWLVFAVAGLNAVANELGIQYRTTTNKLVEQDLIGVTAKS
jgi:hypothetical protein